MKTIKAAKFPDRPLLEGAVTATVHGTQGQSFQFETEFIHGNYGHYNDLIYVNTYGKNNAGHLLFFIPVSFSIGDKELGGTDIVVADTRLGRWFPQRGKLFLESVVHSDYRGRFEMYRDATDEEDVDYIKEGRFLFKFASA